MGARGKKRRRNDGSVATGKAVTRSLPPLVYDDMYPVPPEVLAEAMTIENRYVPISHDIHAAVRAGHWDDASMEVLGEVERLARDRGAEYDAVNVRSGKLAELLREPDREHLYSIAEDGTVTIDEDLLKYAATAPVDNSNIRLRWPADI